MRTDKKLHKNGSLEGSKFSPLPIWFGEFPKSKAGISHKSAWLLNRYIRPSTEMKDLTELITLHIFEQWKCGCFQNPSELRESSILFYFILRWKREFSTEYIFSIMSVISTFMDLRTLLDFLYRDCTRNHSIKKYNSYGVNFWQKSLVYQEGIFQIILWKLLFLANCIVRNQQLQCCLDPLTQIHMVYFLLSVRPGMFLQIFCQKKRKQTIFSIYPLHYKTYPEFIKT